MQFIIILSNKVVSLISNNGLGISLVNGINLVPVPAANIIAFIKSPLLLIYNQSIKFKSLIGKYNYIQKYIYLFNFIP